MRTWMIVMLLAVSLVASGCSKKGNEPAASPTPGMSAQPSTGASASPGASPAVSPGASSAAGGTSATPKATAGTNGGAATATEKPSPLTKEQVEKITLTATYDEVVKQTGAKGVLVKDENGKKTYQYVITNQPGYYAEIVFFNDGKISEKRVFQK